jgi:hypothetical protein
MVKNKGEIILKIIELTKKNEFIWNNLSEIKDNQTKYLSNNKVLKDFLENNIKPKLDFLSDQPSLFSLLGVNKNERYYLDLEDSFFCQNKSKNGYYFLCKYYNNDNFSYIYYFKFVTQKNIGEDVEGLNSRNEIQPELMYLYDVIKKKNEAKVEDAYGDLFK